MFKILERFFKKVDKLFEKDFGKRCKEYQVGCSQCEVYAIYEKFKQELSKESSAELNKEK